MIKSLSRPSYKTKVCQYASSPVVEPIALSQQIRIFAFFSLCISLSVSYNATICKENLPRLRLCVPFWDSDSCPIGDSLVFH